MLGTWAIEFWLEKKEERINLKYETLTQKTGSEESAIRLWNGESEVGRRKNLNLTNFCLRLPHITFGFCRVYFCFSLLCDLMCDQRACGNVYTVGSRSGQVLVDGVWGLVIGSEEGKAGVDREQTGGVSSCTKQWSPFLSPWPGQWL